MADYQRLIPGVGFVDETGSAQRLIPGAGFVDETQAAASTFQVAWAANSNVLIQPQVN